MLLSWLAIVPILLVFSAVVVAGAAARNGGPGYAEAAKDLPKGAPVVAVEVAPKEDSFLDRFRRAYASKELCSVSSSQLAVLAAHYPVRHVTVDGVDVVVLDGGDDHDLKAYLGDAKLKCKLVHESHLFFLPFDAHTS